VQEKALGLGARIFFFKKRGMKEHRQVGFTRPIGPWGLMRRVSISFVLPSAIANDVGQADSDAFLSVALRALAIMCREDGGPSLCGPMV